MADFKVKVETTHDDKGTKEAQSALQRMGTSVAAAWGKVTAVLAAATGAILGAKAAVDEFAEAEERFTSLAQAVANQGELTRAYADALGELAGKMQDATAIADDRWLGVLEQLTKYGANPQNIERYTKSVADLAGLMGGDIETAAALFARAMQGSFDMLSRYGIKVKETGSDTEKLEDLMRQAAERGGGILEARTKTLTGQVAQLSNAWSDLKESVGAFISSTGLLQFALDTTTKAMKWMIGALPDASVGVDQLNNRIGRTAAQSEAAALGVQKLADAYKNAASAAEDMKKADDALQSDETALRLAQVDVMEASKQISPADARRMKASIRLAASRDAAARAEAVLDGRETMIEREKTGAQTAVDAAKARFEDAKDVSDALIARGAQMGFRTATFLRNANPSQIERSLDWDLSLARYRGDRNRVAELESLMDLPGALTTTAKARLAFEAANENAQQTNRRLQPEEERINEQRQRLALQSKTSRFQGLAEAFRIEGEEGGTSLDARILEAFKQYRAESTAQRRMFLEELWRLRAEVEIGKKQLINDINR